MDDRTAVGHAGIVFVFVHVRISFLSSEFQGEGYDVQMHTNQLAHVLLLSKLMPQLEACATQTLGGTHSGIGPIGRGSERKTIHGIIRTLHTWIFQAFS